MAARAVVFGQASALVAALVAGMYGGVGRLPAGAPWTSRPAATRRSTPGFSVLAGIGVIAAAFFLERVCKLPEDDDDERGGAPGAP